MTLYDVSLEAQADLFGIWSHIAEDSIDLANRIDSEFHSLFELLGRMPRMGHARKDLTKRRVLFFPMYSYLVIYEPEKSPIRIMAVLRGKRNVKAIIKECP